MVIGGRRDNDKMAAYSTGGGQADRVATLRQQGRGFESRFLPFGYVPLAENDACSHFLNKGT